MSLVYTKVCIDKMVPSESGGLQCYNPTIGYPAETLGKGNLLSGQHFE